MRLAAGTRREAQERTFSLPLVAVSTLIIAPRPVEVGSAEIDTVETTGVTSPFRFSHRRSNVGTSRFPFWRAPRVAFVIALGVIFWTAQRPVVAAGPQIFTATLTGAQQVPPVASSGTGTGTVLLNAAENQITVNLTFSGLTSNANAAHIHGPAAAGANAGVLFDFTGVDAGSHVGNHSAADLRDHPRAGGGAQGRARTTSTSTPTNFGGGEIRGQIGLAAVQFTTTLTGAQQVPAVSSAGTGTGTVALNAAENQLFVNLSFSGLTSNANAAHIHGPAAAGANAGVLFDFSGVTPAATSGSIPQQTFAISAAQVAELKAGLLLLQHPHRQLRRRRDPRPDRLPGHHHAAGEPDRRRRSERDVHGRGQRRAGADLSVAGIVRGPSLHEPLERRTLQRRHDRNVDDRGLVRVERLPVPGDREQQLGIGDEQRGDAHGHVGAHRVARQDVARLRRRHDRRRVHARRRPRRPSASRRPARAP